MERDINREQTESLIRQITQERERFVSAWQHGAEARELHQIRERIKELNDLLWDTALQPPHRPAAIRNDHEQRDSQNRSIPRSNRP